MNSIVSNVTIFSADAKPEIRDFGITPLQQIVDIKEEERSLEELDRLKRKYDMYYDNQKSQRQDEMILLLNSKDETISELRSNIDSLKQQLVSMSVEFNSKIDDLKAEHKRELHRLHSEFVRRMKN